METPLNIRHGNAGQAVSERLACAFSRASRDARALAILSVAIGLSLFGAGWIWAAFLAEPAPLLYPVGWARFAGVFVGAGIDLGMAAALVGIIGEFVAKGSYPTLRAEETPAEALVSIHSH